ncbi:2-hydroxymuconate tautomerase family protein [Pontibacillus yanchengensis]|uniref:2-hydroxymuconate tautomerase family protein n=2 Tax=Pontibacillus yanchengensis TaxID=462910 RepID=A0ACC7VDD6_9BACI|nr:2-hydroxymuconate tautomerase family protein [Pontibacillus yanchengensis]MYL32105.1 2-hydroxymuconate tautomerase family protein [Pontibacillus yanchengensis]MYL52685.1 2-hydroxymuconate tautomerase family protein [Pontibacillus yanchengensis]
MPIAFLHILEGRNKETKNQLIAEVSEAMSRTLEVDPSKVRVLVQEVPKEHWAEAGITKADRL